jgi:hypothetical protein
MFRDFAEQRFHARWLRIPRNADRWSGRTASRLTSSAAG